MSFRFEHARDMARPPPTRSSRRRGGAEAEAEEAGLNSLPAIRNEDLTKAELITMINRVPAAKAMLVEILKMDRNKNAL